MFKWLHHLLSPHCEHCEREKRYLKECPSCTILTREVERLTHENERLIDRLLEKPESEESKEVNIENLKPIRTSRVPWSVKRQSLEREAHAEAKILAERAKEEPLAIPTKTLEEELGVG